MSEDEIKDLYDTNPNMTLSELSRISGESVSNLKRILMEQA